MMKSGDIINPIASAKITTQESFKFTFGTIEIRAKMPKGNWISAGIFSIRTNTCLFTSCIIIVPYNSFSDFTSARESLWRMASIRKN